MRRDFTKNLKFAVDWSDFRKTVNKNTIVPANFKLGK